MIVHSRTRLAVSVVALLVALTACSGSGRGIAQLPESRASTTAPATPPRSSSPFEQAGDLRWRSCGKPLECATLHVPLDWSAPQGRTVSLHLSRKPATGSHHAGSVVFNFGGPGVAGGSDFGEYVSSFDSAASKLNQSYDLVSWDPRGTGRSAGVACTTKAEALQPDPDPTPDTPAETAALTRKTVADTDRCLREAGPVLPYIDTWSTVRDLDAIRNALHDAKLTYVGFSYGTALGMSYLATYPDRVRAMVLDGIDLPQDPITASHDQAVGFEQAIRTYLAACKSQGRGCELGDGDPQAALTALIGKLEAGERIPASGDCGFGSGVLVERKGTVGIGELYTAIGQAMYDRQLWPILTAGLAGAARASDPDASCLLVLRDYYEGLRPNGSLDHLLDSFHAIGCADQAERSRNPLGDRPDLVAAWSRELPFMGATFAEGLPGCWRYPPARHPRTPFSAATFKGAPPVVVVGNTGDPATPFSHAQTAAGMLPGSVLVTFDSTEHTVFLSHDSRCIDEPLVRYLVTDQLPAQGTVCKP